MVVFQGRIGIIGAGSLASEVIGALNSQGYGNIIATRRTQEKLDELKARYGIEVSNDNTYAAKECDVIILGVKPKVIEEVASEIGPYVADKLIISLAAAKSIAEIEEALNTSARVSRVMVGLFVEDEVAAYTMGSECTEDDREAIKYIFGQDAIELTEELLPHRTWIGCDTGLTPADIAQKIDTLVRLGMERNHARIFYGGMLRAISNQLLAGIDETAILKRVGEEGSFTKSMHDYLKEKGHYDLLDECVEKTVKATGGKK